jgi:hypothetical protein
MGHPRDNRRACIRTRCARGLVDIRDERQACERPTSPKAPWRSSLSGARMTRQSSESSLRPTNRHRGSSSQHPILDGTRRLSREVARNGGSGRPRAARSKPEAHARARRPEQHRRARHARLAQVVEARQDALVARANRQAPAPRAPGESILVGVARGDLGVLLGP